MLLTVEDLTRTSLYPEVIETITRGDNEATKLQILAAESLVRSYMSKYDTAAIFGTETEEPTFRGTDVELIKKVSSIITSYYLVRMAGPGVNLELFRADYEDAISWLSGLQRGEVNPSLPYVPKETPGEPVSEVFATSARKRQNYF